MTPGATTRRARCDAALAGRQSAVAREATSLVRRLVGAVVEAVPAAEIDEIEVDGVVGRLVVGDGGRAYGLDAVLRVVVRRVVAHEALLADRDPILAVVVRRVV